MQKILILGGTGFIGSNLIKFYSQNPNYEVAATSHINEPQVKPENVTFYNVDLTRKEDVEYLFEQVQPEICILVAANTSSSKDVIEAPWLHVTSNSIINTLVLEACYRYKVKNVVFTSCLTMTKSNPLPQKESDWSIGDEIPAQYFGVAKMKVYTENLCEFYSRLSNNKYTVIRLSNVFGPGDKFDITRCHVTAATIKKVHESLDSIEVWGSEENQAKRDLIYVDDVIDLVDKAIRLQKNNYELYNCGCGKAYSITEIVKTVQKVLNKEYLKINYNPAKPNIPTVTIADFTKAYEELGWYPKTSLEDGIAKTVKWYQEHY